ncbi:hypothetical protein AAW14_32810 [Streptomyces hygroscopicus]|uniref:hypothetical protein n=1 Tax=Streptomyces hygroscopicus TaxID=1912 RepID=UPI00223EF31B|nr:hypothetical protein [Streptomyces hygroscopicus]MCW7946631.1 hypothetical protein [Streptomyces hygroscopicus]
MAKTFEELVEMQRAANTANTQAAELRQRYGPPTATAWTKLQQDTYETAWRAWRDLDRDLQAELTDYAKTHGRTRGEIESEVQAQAGGPVEGGS